MLPAGPHTAHVFPDPEALFADLAALDRYDWQGAERPRLLAGTIGPDAIAFGGALLPLHANFAPDHALFLKIDT